MTSTYNDIRSAIEDRIATEMALNPVYPVSYQNVPFNPPNNSPWIQVHIRFGDNTYATLTAPSGGYNRQTGTLVVDVFTPLGDGAGVNFTIAERIKDLFDRAKFANIIFDPASGPAQVTANIIETGVGASSGLAASFFQTEMTATFEAYLE
jgi:hypothetical protein